MLIYSLISVFAISLISLVGLLTLSAKESAVKKYTFVLVALAVGALLGDAFIHLIPEGLEEFGNPTLFSLLIIAGVILFFIIEKYIHWHHHNDDSEENHIHPVGKMILISDGFHNFIDGLIIGASYLVSVEVGIATTLAVLLHEIPQEVGDFAVLVHAGYSRSKALWLNFLSALTALLGTIIVFAVGNFSESFVLWLLPFAAGGFIYIALSDLIPALHQKNTSIKDTAVQIAMIVVGVMAMLALLLVEIH